MLVYSVFSFSFKGEWKAIKDTDLPEQIIFAVTTDELYRNIHSDITKLTTNKKEKVKRDKDLESKHRAEIYIQVQLLGCTNISATVFQINH